MLLDSRTPQRFLRRTPGCWLPVTALVVQLTGGSIPLRAQVSPEVPAVPEQGQQLPEELRVGPPSPFEYGPVLGSRRLRGIRPRVANQLLTEAEGGELVIEALAAPLDGGGAMHVPLFIEVDGASFLQHNQAEIARIEVYAYAFSQDGSIAGYLAEAFAVDVGELGEIIWQNGVKIFAGLELPPGVYTMRILVRNFHSGARGLRELSIVVPNSAAGEPSLLPPIFPGPRGRDSWLPVRTSSVAAYSPYPFVAGGRAVSPAARAVLVANRGAEGYLFGYRLPAGEVRAAVEFLKETDLAVVATTRAELSAQTLTGDGALVVRTVRFTPPDVAPGRYLARVVLKSADSMVQASPPTGVVLIGGGTRERELLWSDLRWMLSAPAEVEESTVPATAPAEPKTREKQRQGARVRRLARRYREVLTMLAQGSGDDAIRALFELESEALGSGQEQALGRLQTAEESVAEELAQSSHLALIPLAMLHADAGERYRSRRLYSLVAHAQMRVEALAVQHAELGGAGDLTARVLSSAAGRLQEANLPASSRRLFLRALDHHRDTPAALLGLAVSYEKYGEYLAALGYLEELVEFRPDFGQALLRLAIIDSRIGRGQEALKLFQRLVENDEGDWVCAIAYQELARIYLLAGEAARAAELLERAVQRMLDRSSHRVLLAHVYDRLGRSAAALQQLLEVRPYSGTLGPPERRLYDEWPRSALEENRSSLVKVAGESTPELEKALAGYKKGNRQKGV